MDCHERIASNGQRSVEDCFGEEGILLNGLADVFERCRYIPFDELEKVAKAAGVSVEVAQTVVERSTAYGSEPVGEHVITVCDGTVCHNRGARDLLSSLESILRIAVGETTEDGRITLRAAQCLGICDRAPVIQVDDEFLGSPESTDARNAVAAAQ